LKPAVGHGMADHANVDPSLFQKPGNLPCDNGLSAPCPHRADGNDRNSAWNHCILEAKKKKIGTFRKDQRGFIHQFFARNIAIGKGNLLGMVLFDQPDKFILRMDGNPIRVVRARQFCRVDPAVNIGNLRGCKGHYFIGGTRSIESIKIMEIPTPRTHDDDTHTLGV
jgi:hypothetical protein